MTRLHVALSLSLVVCLVVGSVITPRVIASTLKHETIVARNGNPNDVDRVDDTGKPGLSFRVSEAAGQP